MSRVRALEDLQRLARCLETLDAPGAGGELARAGVTALPLLLRELSSASRERAALARLLLDQLAATDEGAAERVRQRLRGLVAGGDDTAKERAWRALCDLGAAEPAPTFDDPKAIKRRSAAALADELRSEADVAAAADLMKRRLCADELLGFLELMAEVAPDQAVLLTEELAGRLDLPSELRAEVRRVRPGAQRRPSPGGAFAAWVSATSVCVLGSPDGGHRVLAAGRSATRWRLLSLVIDDAGALAECRYDDDAPRDAGALERSELVRDLVDAGHVVVERDARRARERVADAVRSAVTRARALPAAYYLGRDLLALGDSHLGVRYADEPVSIAIGHATDLLAAGEVAAALELATECARHAPDDAQVAATLGQCLSSAGDHRGALHWLGRAAKLEPTWATHHWNLAAAHHALDERDGCARALAAFLRHGATNRALAYCEEHAARLDLAQRYLAASGAAPATRQRPARSRRRRD